MRPLGLMLLMLTAATFAHAATPGPEGVLRATIIEESPTLAAGQMHWDAGRLLIADRGGNRIVEFRPPGTFKDIGQVENPGGVGVDAAGRVIVVAGRTSSLQSARQAEAHGAWSTGWPTRSPRAAAGGSATCAASARFTPQLPQPRFSRLA